MHIIDFQPFFCDLKDLNDGGIPLKHIYKRQMISPFNLFYNSNAMIQAEQRVIKQVKNQSSYVNRDPSKNSEEKKEFMDKVIKEILKSD